jgi:hypothetical protein
MATVNFLTSFSWSYCGNAKKSQPYVRISLPQLFIEIWQWSNGQSSWLQIQWSGFNSRRYHIFWEVVGLERGPLSIVSTTEELLGRKSSGSGVETQEYGCRNPSCWPRGTLYPQKVDSNFSDKRRSLGRCSSLADPGQGVYFFCLVWMAVEDAVTSHWLLLTLGHWSIDTFCAFCKPSRTVCCANETLVCQSNIHFP